MNTRRDSLIGILIFIFFFSLYVVTLAPTVVFRDSGEFITACYYLNIAHPSGSPLYVLLGKLFTFLPVGTIAYRVNLMSAFFASLAVTFVYLIGLKIFKAVTPSIFAASILGLSQTFWYFSGIAEVYPMKLFFITALIYLILVWEAKPTSRSPLYLGAFLYGVSFGIHTTVVLVFPALLFGLLSINRGILKSWERLIVVVFFYFLGLSIFLYLPIRSSQNPLINWGNTKIFPLFIHHVLGTQYSHRAFSRTLFYFIHNLKNFGGALLKELTVLPVLIAILGAVISAKEKKRYFFLFLVIISVELVFFLFTLKSIATHMLLPSFFVLSIWAGFGYAYILRWKRNKVSYIIGILLIVFTILLPLKINFSFADKSSNYFATQYVESITTRVPPKSIVFLSSHDTIFQFWYTKWVVGNLPEFVPIGVELLSHGWYLEHVQEAYPEVKFPSVELVRKYILELEEKRVEEITKPVQAYIIRYISKNNFDTFPIYFDYHPTVSSPFYIRPVPPIFKLERGEEGKLKLDSREIHTQMDNVYSGIWSDENNYPDQSAQLIFASQHYELGEYFYSKKLFKDAKKQYEKSLQKYDKFHYALYRLGQIALQEKDMETAKGYFEKAIQSDPTYGDAYKKLAEIYKDEGDLEGALKVYRRRVRMRRGDVNGLINLGIISSMLGKLDQAEEYLSKALRINSNSPEANYNLAVVYFQKGKMEKALLYLNKAEKLSPGEVRIKQLRNKLHSANR